MITNPAVYSKAPPLSRIQSAISHSLVFNESAVWFGFVKSVLTLLFRNGQFLMSIVKFLI